MINVKYDGVLRLVGDVKERITEQLPTAETQPSSRFHGSLGVRECRGIKRPSTATGGNTKLYSL